MSRPSADRLREFKSIVDCGSVTGAARQLHMTRPTLSRRLAELEEMLGVPLLRRTTRKLFPTVAGMDLYHRATRIVADIDAAWDAVRHHDGEPRGPLRIGVPTNDLAADDFFVDFAVKFPRVELDVLVVRRDVDLRAAGVDVALQFGEIRDPGLIVKRLGQSVRFAMATREYLDTEGWPQTATDIADHRCIVYRDTDGLPEVRWPLVDGSMLEVRPWLLTNAFHLVLRAVNAGAGIGLIPETPLTSPDLVKLFPDQVQRADPFSLVYVDRDIQLPHIRAFTERANAYWGRWIEHW